MSPLLQNKTYTKAASAPLWVELMCVMFMGIVLFLPMLGQRDIWEAGEARVAVCARHMLESGDWLLPKMGNDIRLEKPPLSYWLCALSGKLLNDGVTETSARLPSVIAAIGVLLLVCIRARLLFGGAAGFLAALLTACTYQFWWEARDATIDMTLLFWTVAALECWWQYEASDAEEAAPMGWWLLGCYAFLGLSMLDKGPVSPLLVLIIITSYRYIAGRIREPIIWRHHLPGIALFLCIALPWYMMVLLETQAYDGTFPAWHIWFKQSAGRLEGFDHLKDPFYFFEKLISDLLPWSMLGVIGAATFLLSGKTKQAGILPRKHWLVLALWLPISITVFHLAEALYEAYPPAQPVPFLRSFFSPKTLGLVWFVASYGGALFFLARKADTRMLQRSWNQLAFPAIWALTTLIFFSIPGSKKDYYILPLIPALGICAGGIIEALRTKHPAGILAHKTIETLYGLLGALLLISGLALPFITFAMPPAWHTYPLMVMLGSGGILLAAGSLLGMVIWKRWMMGVCATCVSLALLCALHSSMLPIMNSEKGDRAFCNLLKPHLAANDFITIFNFAGQPEHLWYCHHHVQGIKDAATLAQRIRHPREGGREFIAISDSGREILQNLFFVECPRNVDKELLLAEMSEGAYTSSFQVFDHGDAKDGTWWMLVNVLNQNSVEDKDMPFLTHHNHTLPMRRILNLITPITPAGEAGRKWYVPTNTF